MPNNNKWVVDWGNPQSGIIYHEEFDTEEAAVEWGKEKNKVHNFITISPYGERISLPITYMHMVYEPEILPDVAPAQDMIEIIDDTAAQDGEESKIKIIKAYRVENPKEKHGIWRDFDGTLNPVFNKLTKGKCKDLPMEDNNFYRQENKQWFSATDTPEKLKAWFNVEDIIELEELGYNVYEFEVEEWKPVSEYEIVFTRESIKWVKAIDPKEIWGEEYTGLKGEM